jgi:hypothetical protein
MTSNPYTTAPIVATLPSFTCQEIKPNTKASNSAIAANSKAAERNGQNTNGRKIPTRNKINAVSDNTRLSPIGSHIIHKNKPSPLPHEVCHIGAGLPVVSTATPSKWPSE